MQPLITHPMAILAVFFTILAFVFNVAERSWSRPLFRFVPPIVFAYFIPTLLTTFGVLPNQSPLYSWIKTFLLPCALFLYTMSLDLPTIISLGPRALGMMLFGTAGVMVGGPVALFVFKAWLPETAWQGMAALAGSWIGGGVNFVAVGQAVNAPDSILGPMIVVDTVLGNLWMGGLIYLIAFQSRLDRFFRADRSSIDVVQAKMEAFQASVARTASFPDLLTIIGLAFALTYVSFALGNVMPNVGEFIEASTWRVILITTFGVLLSFTRFRSYEGAGASRIGSVALYLLITTIGAQANLRGVVEFPALILAGALWLVIHGIFLVIGAIILRAPYFFLAVGSQANIGAAASAPVVAAAFHPALAPVGLLLAILGYVLGTYAALLCAYVMRIIAS